MTRKTEIGYYALLVVLVLGSLRFGQLMWQQQQTLSHLQKQAKQLKNKQVTAKTSHQKVKQVVAKSTITKASETSQQFFNLAYNWSSGSDYKKRITKIKQAKLVTSQVLANDYLFPEVGGTADYIDNNGLKSSVVQVAYYPKTTNDDQTSGIVGVAVNAKHDSDVGNGETRYYYFNIDYQASDNQITSLDYIGRLAVNQSTDFNTFNPYE
jgi:Sec-independent protein translocase protein TatA